MTNNKYSNFIFSNVKDSQKCFGITEGGNEVYSKVAQPSKDIFKRKMMKIYNSKGLIIDKTDIIIENLIMAVASGNEIIAVSCNLPLPAYKVLKKYADIHAIRLIEFNSYEGLIKVISNGAKAILMASSSSECNGLAIEKVSCISKNFEIPLIVENTFCTAYGYNPFVDGADIIIDFLSVISAEKSKGNYVIVAERGKFDWNKNNKYIRLYPFQKYEFVMTAYLYSICRRKSDLKKNSREVNADFYMLNQGLYTIENRINIYSENSEKLSKRLLKYSDTLYIEKFYSLNSMFIFAIISEKYIKSLKEGTLNISINKKSQLYDMYNCTSVFWQGNKLYIRLGTEPYEYIDNIFKAENPPI